MSGWSDLGPEWRMCGRKRRYLSRREALADHPEQRAYSCPICFKWHLTSKPRKP